MSTTYCPTMLRAWVVAMVCISHGMVYSSVTSQTCQQVGESLVTCEQSGAMDVVISCPSLYIIKVHSSAYQVADTATCPAQADPAHCHETIDLSGLVSRCHKKERCSVSVPRAAAVSCSVTGTHYVHLVYNCEPLQFQHKEKATVTSITTPPRMQGFQLVYVSSDQTVLKKENEIDFEDTSLGCMIYVPPHVQLSFQLFYLSTKPSSADDNCNQRIQLFDGDKYERTLCSSDNLITMAGCDVSKNIIYLRYQNDDMAVKVRFLLAVAVSHHLDTLDMTCGLPVTGMNAPNTTRPTVRPSTRLTTRPAGSTGITDTADASIPKTKLSQPLDTKRFVLFTLLAVTACLVVIAVIVGLSLRGLRKQKSNMVANRGLMKRPRLRSSWDVNMGDDGNSTLVMSRHPHFHPWQNTAFDTPT